MKDISLTPFLLKRPVCRKQIGRLLFFVSTKSKYKVHKLYICDGKHRRMTKTPDFIRRKVICLAPR